MSDWTPELIKISDRLAEHAAHIGENTYYLAICEINKLRKQLRWIPVEESLPEIDELIWTYEEDANMDEQYRYNSGWYAGIHKKFNWYTGVDYGEPVPTAHDNEYTWSFTHWMRVIRKEE